jgi:hypothetical protein
MPIHDEMMVGFFDAAVPGVDKQRYFIRKRERQPAR